ncbi:MAG: hypothetical protein J0M08_01245 [Bacteroidetes bacterium]|nr:hypothetical protein [Bacteroidota bacterium]
MKTVIPQNQFLNLRIVVIAFVLLSNTVAAQKRNKNLISHYSYEQNATAVDSEGNTYKLGNISNQIAITKKDKKSENLIDIVLEKFNVLDELVWRKTIGGNGIEMGYSLAIDNTNAIYITGYFTEITDLDPSENVFALNTDHSSATIFVSKYESNGNFVWAINMGVGSGYAIDTDKEGAVYVTGGKVAESLSSQNTIDGGYSDIFICKLDKNGNSIWNHTLGGNGNDIGYKLFVESSTISICGVFSGENIDFDPSSNTYVLSADSRSERNRFIQRLDLDGNFISAVNTDKIGGGLSTSGLKRNIDELNEQLNFYSPKEIIE